MPTKTKSVNPLQSKLRGYDDCDDAICDVHTWENIVPQLGKFAGWVTLEF